MDLSTFVTTLCIKQSKELLSATLNDTPYTPHQTILATWSSIKEIPKFSFLLCVRRLLPSMQPRQFTVYLSCGRRVHLTQNLSKFSSAVRLTSCLGLKIETKHGRHHVVSACHTVHLNARPVILH